MGGVAPGLRARVEEWIARDPGPRDPDGLGALLEARDGAALGQRFGGRLAFGTAGLRGSWRRGRCA